MQESVCIDFGVSKVYNAKEQKGALGTPIYMAPEVLGDDPYGPPADVYSFGVLLWELVICQVPYADQCFRSGASGLLQIYQHVIEEQRRPPLPPPHICPLPLAQLIEDCWQADPALRPSFQQILDSHILDQGKPYKFLLSL